MNTAPTAEPDGRPLRELFQAGVSFLSGEVADPGHQALLYLPFAARSQFYFDGNKRTARWMMNGHLISHGYEPIGVPVDVRQRWNEALVHLFASADATPLLVLLADCQFSILEEQAR